MLTQASSPTGKLKKHWKVKLSTTTGSYTVTTLGQNVTITLITKEMSATLVFGQSH